jgi:ABC transport system ATP-binding/permease protein
LVSHDRAFLDNVVTEVFAFEGSDDAASHQGTVREYVGGYSDWLEYKTQAKTGFFNQNTAKTPVNTSVLQNTPASKKTKLSFNDARELEQLPSRIEAWEAEQQTIQARLADGSIYSTAPEEAATLARRLDEVSVEIDAALQRWETLEQKKNG